MGDALSNQSAEHGDNGQTVITGQTALLSVESCLESMSLFPVFYCSLPNIGTGFKPVEASDAYEAEQIV